MYFNYIDISILFLALIKQYGLEYTKFLEFTNNCEGVLKHDIIFYAKN
jgi:hypothetical protein